MSHDLTAPPVTGVSSLARADKIEHTSYLKMRSKISYGLGDVASQLAWSLGTSYLALYYTDSVGLAVGSVATLMLVARILDALVDPVIGGLAERTRSRFGRFRPWILFGAPALGLMLVLYKLIKEF